MLVLVDAPKRQGNRLVRTTMLRIGRVLKRAWQISNAVRVAVFNLLFIIVVIGLVVWLFRSDGPSFADHNALVLAPKGTIVDQLSGGGPSASALLTGGPGEETLLRDMIETIERAGGDERRGGEERRSARDHGQYPPFLPVPAYTNS